MFKDVRAINSSSSAEWEEKIGRKGWGTQSDQEFASRRQNGKESEGMGRRTAFGVHTHKSTTAIHAALTLLWEVARIPLDRG